MRVSAGVAGLFALAVAVAEAFVVPLTTMPAHHRPSSHFHSSPPPMMSLQGNEKVVVYAGFERIAMTLLKSLGDAGFQPVCPVPAGFTKDSKVKWVLDGLAPTLPPKVELAPGRAGVPAGVEGCVLASEAPVTGEECVGALNLLQGVSKVVFLSRVGVERRGNFMLKINPFLKLDAWYEAEEAVKAWCSQNSVELTIVRTGNLEGGPFYHCQPEFQAALEGSLFDVEHKAMKLSGADTFDGATSRDLVSVGVVQALKRDVPVFSLVSAKDGPLRCSVRNHMNLPVEQNKERVVWTPSDAEWDAAFSQL